MRRHGEGHWESIFSESAFPGRTAVDLKDKWRNVKLKASRYD